jgi:hypothetical protein
MGCGSATVVPSVQRSEQIDDFDATGFSDDQPIRTHSQ